MEKGWLSTDVPWERIWYIGISFEFEYEGKAYFCCVDQSPDESYVYTLPDYKKIATYPGGEEGFYKAKLFGKSLKEIIDDSYITHTC